MKLSGHKILLTGGSAGIGFELAQALVSRNNQVAICGRDPQKLAKARELLGDVITIQSDLAIASQIPKLAEEATQQLGGLSMLINNAGIQQQINFIQTDTGHIAQAIANEIQINLTALMTLTAVCLPLLKKAKSAAVVNLSSALAITPKASAPVYCATKAAIHSFSQSLRYQMEDALPTVQVFEVIPPLVDTQMTHGRGKGKISPQQVALETLQGIERGQQEIPIGKAKVLRSLHRLVPALSAKILRNS
ncbi:SDR family oxidoreductase [Calothrix rhizosoleniae]|uniref:SDR family oxidoreductase n=1 Tax=Calothrix rhizosoleniae TaxID=888997 RepID=UPI000B4A4958|nr:SDR family NAD(P)-dependent oxidoreductase [Calothrix rhizosoleniae]